MINTRNTKIALAITAVLTAGAANASSHREAPNMTKTPTVDSTDFYMFNSYEEGRGDFVTIIANYIPLQDAYGGPNYFAMDQDATYSIHIDNDGDANEDLTFAFNFTKSSPGIALDIGPEGDKKSIAVPLVNVGGISAGNDGAANFSETYEVSLIEGSMRNGTRTAITRTSGASVQSDYGSQSTFEKPLDYIGNKTFTDEAGYSAYAGAYIYNMQIPGCSTEAKVFVGQRKDAFVVNLGKTFDLVNYVPVEGDSVRGNGDGDGFPDGITQDSSNDDLIDKNVTSIAIEIPKSCITGEGNGVVGGWTTASLPQVRILNPNATFDKPAKSGGALTQVSRLGSPLVNELVIGLKDKDAFSSSHPKDDGQFADYVTNPSLPELLNILFLDAVNARTGGGFETLAPTNFPRVDLVTAFLTGFPGVNQMSTVTASEMLRLNTGIAARPAAEQSPFGVAGDDLAGFPNGRRPGDDVVDIALRVVMGALCHPIPINGEPQNLGLCEESDASVGNQAFTDGAPSDASMMMTAFPYLATPIAGSK
ncbi:MAG: hypothetical protein ACJAYN_001400 [Bermanella sp.]|jgi:hypothetical protein